MTPNAQQLVKHLFGGESLDEVPEWQLRDLVSEYPYFNPGHYFLSKKLGSTRADDQLEVARTAALHFINPFWLKWMLEYRAEPAPESVSPTEPAISEPAHLPTEEIALPAPPSSVIIKEEKKESIDEEPKLFEPYFTIDYFASQGIKLNFEDIPADRFGQQLKSFTDWLKVMKRIPQQTVLPVDDEAADAVIRDIANHSNDEKEVLTETMANVLARQGKHEKARELYHKLSLLNPDKSAYFAAKIDQLKAY